MAEFTITVDADDEIMLKAMCKTMAAAWSEVPTEVLGVEEALEGRGDEFRAGFASGMEHFRKAYVATLEALSGKAGE